MKRYFQAFLLAYSISMTLLAAWLAARGFIFGQIISARLGFKGTSPTYEQILSMIGGPRSFPGPANETAMLIAGLDPINMAAAAFLILITCLGFASRRSAKPTNPDLQKD